MRITAAEDIFYVWRSEIDQRAVKCFGVQKTGVIQQRPALVAKGSLKTHNLLSRPYLFPELPSASFSLFLSPYPLVFAHAFAATRPQHQASPMPSLTQRIQHMIPQHGCAVYGCCIGDGVWVKLGYGSSLGKTSSCCRQEVTSTSDTACNQHVERL